MLSESVACRRCGGRYPQACQQNRWITAARVRVGDVHCMRRRRRTVGPYGRCGNFILRCWFLFADAVRPAYGRRFSEQERRRAECATERSVPPARCRTDLLFVDSQVSRIACDLGEPAATDVGAAQISPDISWLRLSNRAQGFSSTEGRVRRTGRAGLMRPGALSCPGEGLSGETFPAPSLLRSHHFVFRAGIPEKHGFIDRGNDKGNRGSTCFPSAMNYFPSCTRFGII
jgi:hypothetical protein